MMITIDEKIQLCSMDSVKPFISTNKEPRFSCLMKYINRKRLLVE